MDANAQDAKIPVLRAKSATIDVEDGHNVRKGHWTVAPELALDTYYAQRHSGSKTVIFRSDVDEIRFQVKPGEQYDFIILLNGKECRTRISTLRQTATRTSEVESASQIPFKIGPDHKIHIHGSINGSATLDFMFDTGADNVVLYKSGYDKVKLNFDGEIDNSGLGGTTKRRTSNDNRIDIANLRWDHELILFIENQADQADGIIGYNIFEDKILEIDYDKMHIFVHDSLPPTNGFARSEMRFPGTIPVLETILKNDQSVIRDWLVIDTGYSGSVYLNHALMAKHGWNCTLKSLGSNRSRGVGENAVEGEYALLPNLTIGGATLRQIPISVELPSGEPQNSNSLLGMDVLKRFNTIIDYQTNEVYLKQNTLFDLPFRQPPYRPIVFMFALAGVLLCLLVVLWANRKRKQRPNHNA